MTTQIRPKGKPVSRQKNRGANTQSQIFTKQLNNQNPCSTTKDFGIYQNKTTTYVFGTHVVGQLAEIVMIDGTTILGVVRAVSPLCEFGLMYALTTFMDNKEKQFKVEDRRHVNFTDIKRITIAGVGKTNHTFKPDSEIAQQSSTGSEASEFVPYFDDCDEVKECNVEVGEPFRPEDMFIRNEQVSTVASTYNDTLDGYTVPVDKLHPDYPNILAKCTELAAKHEDDANFKAQLRDTAIENECENEEAKFSAVIRGPQSYGHDGKMSHRGSARLRASGLNSGGRLSNTLPSTGDVTRQFSNLSTDTNSAKPQTFTRQSTITNGSTVTAPLSSGSLAKARGPPAATTAKVPVKVTDSNVLPNASEITDVVSSSVSVTPEVHTAPTSEHERTATLDISTFEPKCTNLPEAETKTEKPSQLENEPTKISVIAPVATISVTDLVRTTGSALVAKLDPQVKKPTMTLDAPEFTPSVYINAPSPAVSSETHTLSASVGLLSAPGAGGTDFNFSQPAMLHPVACTNGPMPPTHLQMPNLIDTASAAFPLSTAAGSNMQLSSGPSTADLHMPPAPAAAGHNSQTASQMGFLTAQPGGLHAPMTGFHFPFTSNGQPHPVATNMPANGTIYPHINAAAAAAAAAARNSSFNAICSGIQAGQSQQPQLRPQPCMMFAQHQVTANNSGKTQLANSGGMSTRHNHQATQHQYHHQATPMNMTRQHQRPTDPGGPAPSPPGVMLPAQQFPTAAPVLQLSGGSGPGGAGGVPAAFQNTAAFMPASVSPYQHLPVVGTLAPSTAVNLMPGAYSTSGVSQAQPSGLGLMGSTAVMTSAAATIPNYLMQQQQPLVAAAVMAQHQQQQSPAAAQGSMPVYAAATPGGLSHSTAGAPPTTQLSGITNNTFVHQSQFGQAAAVHMPSQGAKQPQHALHLPPCVQQIQYYPHQQMQQQGHPTQLLTVPSGAGTANQLAGFSAPYAQTASQQQQQHAMMACGYQPPPPPQQPPPQLSQHVHHLTAQQQLHQQQLPNMGQQQQQSQQHPQIYHMSQHHHQQQGHAPGMVVALAMASAAGQHSGQPQVQLQTQPSFYSATMPNYQLQQHHHHQQPTPQSQTSQVPVANQSQNHT